MQIKAFFRPTFFKIVLFICTVAIFATVITERVATSKVTWDISKGFPFTIIKLDIYSFCTPMPICGYKTSTEFNIPALIADTVIAYLISCIIACFYSKISPSIQMPFNPLPYRKEEEQTKKH